MFSAIRKALIPTKPATMDAKPKPALDTHHKCEERNCGSDTHHGDIWRK
jgi:hypothetical protein